MQDEPHDDKLSIKESQGPIQPSSVETAAVPSALTQEAPTGSLCDLLHEPSWRSALQEEFSKPYFRSLDSFVQGEMSTQQVFPPREMVFRAFNSCPFEKASLYMHRRLLSLSIKTCKDHLRSRPSTSSP